VKKKKKENFVQMSDAESSDKEWVDDECSIIAEFPDFSRSKSSSLSMPHMAQMQVSAKEEDGPNDFSGFVKSHSQPSQIDEEEEVAMPKKKKISSAQRKQRVMCSQVLLPGGKRAHIFIKTDPEVEREQDEEFRAQALQAVSGSDVSEQCRQDVEQTLQIMREAKDAWQDKRLEAEGAFGKFISTSGAACRTAKSMLIGQGLLFRKRNLYSDSVDKRNMLVQSLAEDLSNKTIAFTFCDVVDLIPNKSGCSLHVRLKYCSTESLPLDSNLDQHIAVARNLAMECFPNKEKNVVCLASEPYLKLARTKPDSAQPLLCRTMHLIWPHIVVYDARELIVFWRTFDMRLSAEYPFYSNIVAVHLESKKVDPCRVRLRMLGSYRVLQCKHCRQLDTPMIKNSEVSPHGDFEVSDSDFTDQENEESSSFTPPTTPPTASPSLSQRSLSYPSSNNTPASILQSLSQHSLSSNSNSRSRSKSANDLTRSYSGSGFNTCFHCIRGHIVCPYGVLKPYAFYDASLNVLDKTSFRELPVIEQLQKCSIAHVKYRSNVTALSNLSDNEGEQEEEIKQFVIPEDAPAVEDRSHTRSGCPPDLLAQDRSGQIGYGCNHILYESEFKEMKRRANALNNQSFTPYMRPDLFSLCTQVVRSVHEVYKYVVASHITIATKKKKIYVSIQGKNQRYCLLHEGMHDDSRVTFTIDPTKYSISVQCFHPVCRALVKEHLNYVLFNIQTKLYKRDGAAGGKRMNISKPTQMNLTPEQIIILESMRVIIPVESGWRAPLYAAVGLIDMGPKPKSARPMHTLGGPPLASKSGILEEPLRRDPETNMMLPRSMIHLPISQKLEYLNAHRTVIKAQTLSFSTAPSQVGHVHPVVTTSPFAISERPSRQERELQFKKLLQKKGHA